MRRLTIPILLLLICQVTAASSAENDGEKARAAFDTGIKHFHNGEYREAAAAFRRANELSPSWKLLFNIGQAEAAAGRNGLALIAFEEYIARGGDNVDPTRQSQVLSEIKRLREIVGILEVTAPKGAVIYVDDEVRGTAPLEGSLFISAGVGTRIKAVLNEKEIFSQTVRLGGRQTKNLVISAADDKAASNCTGSAAWLDADTGLCWMRSQTTTGSVYRDAVQYCEQSSAGGYDDWRLPTVSELRSIIKECDATGLSESAPCKVGDFSPQKVYNEEACKGCTSRFPECYLSKEAGGCKGRVWSSSGVGDYIGTVAFSSGNVGTTYPSTREHMYVRCIREAR